MTAADSLVRLFGPEIRKNVPLSPLSSMAVGGSAELYFEPRRIQDLLLVRKLCSESDLPLHIIGGGSNIIVDDKGLKGLVVSTLSLNGLEIVGNNEVYVTALSGVLLKRLVGMTLGEGFSGLEFAVGIPGTLGGALYGNAGVRGHAISDLVNWVETSDAHGVITRRSGDQIDWGYRYSELSSEDGCILRCNMNLVRSSKPMVRSLARSFWQKRVHQPYGFKSAGCVFKNPDGDSAGRLLEESGCKELRKGNALVSDFHANFIVNLGGAAFSDIMWLIKECKKRVREYSGINLSLEVNILSDERFEI